MVMRRPVNWVVFCFSVSLAFLFALASLPGREVQPAIGLIDLPAVAEAIPSVALAGARPTPEFGYVRADGSFVPLAQQSGPTTLTSASPSWR
jgi:hypothetical protein